MRSINGRICVGMAGSKARFENSKRVCANCIERHTVPGQQLMTLKIGDEIVTVAGTCDCCEEQALVAVIGH